jgi:hypothetical protein
LHAAYKGHAGTRMEEHPTDRSLWLKDALKGAKDFVKGKR